MYYVDARRAKTTLSRREIGDRKIGDTSEGIFFRLPFSCPTGYATIKSI
jgi:hypothetical protein